MLVQRLAALVDRAQAGDRGRCHADGLGGVTQKVSGKDAETGQWPAADAHEKDHERGREPVVSAELGPDRLDVGLRQLEELLAVELAQTRRQALLTDETRRKGRHRSRLIKRSLCVRPGPKNLYLYPRKR